MSLFGLGSLAARPLALPLVPVIALSLLTQSTSRVGARAEPSRPDRAERRVPFAPGETLTYDVSWSAYLTAGTATMTVKEKKSSFGSTAYYIVAEARPTSLLARLYTLYYKADTLVDIYTLLPQRGSVYSEEGRRHRFKTTRFNHAARTAEFEMHTATLMKKSLPVPAYTQDVVSVLYAVRTLRLREGAKMTIPVCDSGEVYTVEVAIGPRKQVPSGIGSLPAWRLTPRIVDSRGEAQNRPMTLWLSTDARRLPVKMEAELVVGKISLTLKEVAGPG